MQHYFIAAAQDQFILFNHNPPCSRISTATLDWTNRPASIAALAGSSSRCFRHKSPLWFQVFILSYTFHPVDNISAASLTTNPETIGSSACFTYCLLVFIIRRFQVLNVNPLCFCCRNKKMKIDAFCLCFMLCLVLPSPSSHLPWTGLIKIMAAPSQTRG